MSFNTLPALKKKAESLLKELTYIGQTGTSPNSSIGFSGTLPLGDPHSQRICIFAICMLNVAGDAEAPSNVTLGGVAATLVANSNNGTYRVRLYQVALPSGNSATISLNTTVAHYYSILSFRAINLVSGVASDTAANSGASAGVRSTTIDAPTTGFVVGAACGGATFGSDETWSGLVEVVDGDILSSLSYNGARYATPGATEADKAISCSLARVLVAAAWA